MGAAKTKRQRFLQEHKFCCFCGGDRLANTIDHVPNRACFPERVGPEGYEFPACTNCQERFRLEEHYFALICRISDHDNSNYDSKTSKRLIQGIQNNLPHLMPDVRLSSNQKRRVLREMGLQRGPKIALPEVPLARYPIESDVTIRKVVIKLGLALLYRQTNKIAKGYYYCSSHWTHITDRKAINAWEVAVPKFTGVEWAVRSNMNFGNRFRFGWIEGALAAPDIFICIAEFGLGMTVCAMIWDPTAEPELEYGPGVISVERWAKGHFPIDWPFNEDIAR